MAGEGWEKRAREADGWRGPAEEGELANDPVQSRPRDEAPRWEREGRWTLGERDRRGVRR
jgi:hypothetical protein